MDVPFFFLLAAAVGWMPALLKAKPILEDPSYSLVRAFPDNSSQVDLLHELRYKKNGLLVDFWRAADSPGQHVDIWVQQPSDARLFSLLGKNRIKYSIRLTNLTRSVELANVSMANIDHFDSKYHSFNEINSELKRLEMGYSEMVTLINIGKSYEDRDVYAIQINKNAERKKPLILINCGIHGREWLAISACMRVIRRIIFNQKYEKEIQQLTDNFEIVILPVLNTDGYVYTRTTNRYWRKSRSVTDDKNCPGVDLNRNFIFKWGGRGASPDYCDETYSGQTPFSEPEVLALARYMYSRRSDLKAFLDIHTFGQLLMYPWGYTKQKSFHSKKQAEVLKKVAENIGWATGSRYKYGPASNVLYETAGDSTDWAYGFLGILHSYGIELRPIMTGGGTLAGFRQDASEIIPTAKELFIAIREVTKFVYQEANLKRTK